MLKKTRTILFSVCAILFLLIPPSVVLYSQGYRIDFESKKVVRTGGFYFKVWPKSAQVFIDGKLKKKTDVLFGSVFIENLLPKRYKIEIKKEGYYPWQKNLEVQEKMVTEAKNIVLIPENPGFTILEENIKSFFFLPNGKRLILDSKEGLKLLEIEREIKDYPIEKIVGEEIGEIVFSPDSQKILFKTGSQFNLLDLTRIPFSPIELNFLKPGIYEISFHPQDLTKVFFIEKDELFEGDLEKKEISPLLKGVLTYKILAEKIYPVVERSHYWIYYLDNSGFLFKTDFSQRIKERINEIVFPIKEGVSYQLEVFADFIFLKENEVLYLFSPDSQSFEKFFEPIKSLKISPDFRKMVYFGNFEIWLFFFESSFDQPRKEVKEKVFLTRFSEKIENLSWYTAHYLIFNTDSKIKIAEIDDREGINIYDLIEFSSVAKSYGGPVQISGEDGKDSKIFFNQIDKKIYLLSEGKFLVSEKLIP